MSLSSGVAVCAGPGDQVGAPGGKSPIERRSGGPKMALKGEVGAKLKRSVRGALWELWELLETRRTTLGNQVKAELEVYLADHSND